MSFNRLNRWAFFLMTVSFLFFLASCRTTGGGVGFQWDYGGGHGHPHDIKTTKGGPPSHAPAHGYRAKHHYRYYPSCSVYYDTYRKLYFYLEGANWRMSVSLPSTLHVRLGNYVAIEMDTDKPYTHYGDHKRKYPPGQLKKYGKKKQKWG